ncbi:hypothetical protein [Rhizobium leguminosarum]|uniref:hypothetical protein n=1 Tax=Rhizobium leguminosarum TaxID=384 RepID=UPI001C961B57|nr:hypothetical protein [Rhizobium leguminosarum]MBY5524332.1 hypothetical protein [Rhizobium leguminosarum]MBY5643745.1 hypothetical protein [Rhizobium leguminosarum]
MSLQTALDLGIVVVRGTGDYSEVLIGNRTLDKAVKVTVSKSSVLAPDAAYVTSDLEPLAQIGASTVDFDQVDLWDARQDPEAAARYLGLSSTALDGLPSFVLPAMAAFQNFVAYHNRTVGPGGQAFAIRRIHGARGVEYQLFDGEKGVILALGNHNLDSIAKAISERTNRLPGEAARIVLGGDGDEADFEAAKMTLETSAGGDGTMVPFSFIPAPPDFPPMGGTNFDGGSPASPVVAHSDGRRERTVPFLDRGFVVVSTVVGTIKSWPALLAAMATGVNRAAKVPNASSMSAADAIAMIEDNVDEEIQREKDAQGVTGKLPPNSTTTESHISGAIKNRVYSEMSFGSDKARQLASSR